MSLKTPRLSDDSDPHMNIATQVNTQLGADINICGSASASRNAVLHFANFLQTRKDSPLLGYGNDTPWLDHFQVTPLSFTIVFFLTSLFLCLHKVKALNMLYELAEKINIVKLCRKLLF